MRKPFCPLTVARCKAIPLAIALAIALLAPVASADATRERPPRARALDLFEQSARAYREGRFQDAIDLLLEARRVKPEPVLLYNLGRAYEALGKQTEAADAYAGYIAEDPRAADRRAIEGRIVTLRQQAEQLDKARNAPPQLAPPEERRPPPEPPEPAPAPPSVAPYVVTAVGIAGLGTGVVLGVLANKKHDAAVAERAQATAQHEQSSAKSLATGATIALVAGGVVTVAGLTWLGIRAFTPSPRVSVLAGPGSVIVKGTF